MDMKLQGAKKLDARSSKTIVPIVAINLIEETTTSPANVVTPEAKSTSKSMIVHDSTSPLMPTQLIEAEKAVEVEEGGWDDEDIIDI